MSQAVLHHQRVVAPDATPSRYLLGLHGIFGMGRNWTTFAQQLVQARPDWGVVLADLRLHGRSPDFAPPHTLEACAGDVNALVRFLQLPVRGIMGHSFGGKVALIYAREHGADLGPVWVMDSTPESHRSATDALTVLETMRRLPMPQPSRGAVIKALQEEGLSPAISQWLATNVEPRHNQFHWRFDFDGLEALMLDFYETDLWDMVEAPPFRTELHFVKAERSEVLSEEGAARIEAAGTRNGRVKLHVLPAAGHWVHVDNPGSLLELVLASL